MHRAASTQAGFTLLELLTAVTVLAVLLGIGVPAFNGIIRSNRTAAQANEVVAALSFARSEANKRGLPVSVCAANTAQSACAGATVSDWANGWLVFTDRVAPAGAINVGDELLQTSRAVTGGLQLQTASTGFVRLGANGAPTNGAAFGLVLKPAPCSGKDQRAITLNLTGRVSLAKVSCT